MWDEKQAFLLITTGDRVEEPGSHHHPLPRGSSASAEAELSKQQEVLSQGLPSGLPYLQLLGPGPSQAKVPGLPAGLVHLHLSLLRGTPTCFQPTRRLQHRLERFA